MIYITSLSIIMITLLMESFFLKDDEHRSNGNEYDEGDSHLARGSQDPGTVQEPRFLVEDACAVILDQGDFNLLQGCQDTGEKETNHNRQVG